MADLDEKEKIELVRGADNSNKQEEQALGISVHSTDGQLTALLSSNYSQPHDSQAQRIDPSAAAQNDITQKKKKAKAARTAQASTVWYVCVALLLWVFCWWAGDSIQVGRAWVLSGVNKLYGPNAYIRASQDLMQSLSACGHKQQSFKVGEDLIVYLEDTLKTKKDQRIAFVKLILARDMFHHDLGKTVEYTKSALSMLTGPEPNTPIELCSEEWELAKLFSNRGSQIYDSSLSDELYKSAISYWEQDPSFGLGMCQCYLYKDAADNAEQWGKRELALEYARKAVDSAAKAGWTETEGQVDRMGRVAQLLNSLNRPEEAKEIAEKAVAIAETKLEKDNYWGSRARAELDHANHDIKLLRRGNLLHK